MYIIILLEGNYSKKNYCSVSQPGEFIHTLGDSHVYCNHVAALKEQLKRKPRPFPTLHINREVQNIEDFRFEDFELCNYIPYPKINMEMAV
jgi:thymidylate synthase